MPIPNDNEPSCEKSLCYEKIVKTGRAGARRAPQRPSRWRTAIRASGIRASRDREARAAPSAVPGAVLGCPDSFVLRRYSGERFVLRRSEQWNERGAPAGCTDSFVLRPDSFALPRRRPVSSRTNGRTNRSLPCEYRFVRAWGPTRSCLQKMGRKWGNSETFVLRPAKISPEECMFQAYSSKVWSTSTNESEEQGTNESGR